MCVIFPFFFPNYLLRKAFRGVVVISVCYVYVEYGMLASSLLSCIPVLFLPRYAGACYGVCDGLQIILHVYIRVWIVCKQVL